jgi:YD repeat-containing protein
VKGEGDMTSHSRIPTSHPFLVKGFARLIGICSLLVGLSAAAVGQQPDPAARPDRGTRPVGSYSVSDIENISLVNGNVNLSIPLAALPPIAGGKLSWTVSAHYNSKSWDTKSYENAADQSHNNFWTAQSLEQSGRAGWTVGGSYAIYEHLADWDFVPVDPGCTGGLACNEHAYRYKMFLVTPDGAQHELRPMDYSPGATQNFRIGFYKDTPATTQTTMRYYSFDGSYLYATVDAYPLGGQPATWSVYLPDGTKIKQKTAFQRISDPNGNSIKIYSETDANGVVTTHYQDEDTLATGAREIQVLSYPDGSVQVKYQTVTGVLETIDIAYGTTHIDQLYNINDRVCPDVMALLDDDIQVIRSITLPQTEPNQSRKQFLFNYNSDAAQDPVNLSWRSDCSAPFITQSTLSHGWGSLSRMQTPDGAVVTYSYKLDGDSTRARQLHGAKEAAGEVITQKQVSHDGGTVDTWTYTIDQGQGTVAGPDGAVTQEQFYPHDTALASTIAGSDGRGGLVYKTTQSSKQVIERHWSSLLFSSADGSAPNGQAAFNPVVDTEYLTVLDGQGNPAKMSAKTYQYDYNGNRTQEVDYDWFDPGLVQRDTSFPNLPLGVPAGATALRTVTSSYYNTANGVGSLNVYAKRDLATITPLILNAMQETVVGSSDTRLSYDNQAFGTAPSVGHVTTEARWDNRASRWINITHTYDATYGNLTSTTDPRNNVTSFAYTDSTHALPTSITVDPLNGTGAQTTAIAYDYYTGLVTSRTDVAGNTTVISYLNQQYASQQQSVYDPYGRPGVVTGPAVTVTVGGVTSSQQRQVVTSYSDSQLRTTVESDLNATGDKKLKTRTTHDQMGRVIKTETSEDGNSYTIFVNTVYQQMGRITYVSNPLRATAGATDGWTRATKDDFGRVIEVATFAGASQPPSSGTNTNWTGSVTTSYDRIYTTVTDQAGKVRRSFSDGLGRLQRVDEPDGNGNLGTVDAPVQPTTYSYDALGNLTLVQQGGQQRQFVYDSLSRLREAYNPEQVNSSSQQVATTYSYDDASNLLSRTNPTGSAVSFTYDGLNRVLTKTLSSGGTWTYS